MSLPSPARRLLAAVLLCLPLACDEDKPPPTEPTPAPGTIPTPQVPPRDDQVRAVTAPNNVVVPTKAPFSEARLSQLTVPAGFTIHVFAQGLTNPRTLAVRADGGVYVTEREAGRVTLLRDTNGDGRADQQTVVASGLGQKRAGVHGLALNSTGDRLFMTTDRQVLAADVRPDGSLGAPVAVGERLPDSGQHPNRTLAFGPDGLLYVSVGSTCNACSEPNPENATLLRMAADGTGRAVFARGLRNTIGFGWHPGTGQLWGMDHGSDSRGDDFPPEELNRIQQGADYGWPFCAGKREVDAFISAEPPDMRSRPDYCAGTQPSVLEYQSHSAPMTWVFYTGTQFPAEYRNDAFVAMRGSWNRNPPSGYKVVRVRFDAQGNPTAIEDFATGWLANGGNDHLGRLVGTAIAADGALLVTDDANGVIYRIAYSG
ncbi:sorbosone dehydrogenase family protein [Pyxidicoccus fallax]|uniref:Sorbosone dehydrogenase family protein n=1 Tax=Pyxidicoccus fallax TaxID=394095 RepID=A0A848LCW0_9BACT|nr:PQQ-dependent sugar dehydrogenase [Pyxidicoccus fallax]NMO14593.1 sorbosone dehydrogenase family protein [Pyxidicoccus fallax]NPC78932.1 sorbosone dehydrogenase family protein [Pyxidicoccus fallax]